MHYQQSISNTVAKRGHSSEMNKWRDAGVDPELLYDVEPAETPKNGNAQPQHNLESLAPHVAEWDRSLFAREAARQTVAATVTVEQA